MWGYARRGTRIDKTLEFAPGNAKNDIELIGIKTTHPGIVVTTEKKTRGNERVITATFALAPDAPLGSIEAAIEARVRVAGEEAQITAPLHGEVIGDLLVSPPSIISPQIAHAPGQRISEITVRASVENAPPPKLLGAMAVGDVKAVIVKDKEQNAHTIAVHAGDAAGAGPQAGTVYVMTDSVDQPITAVPVYFRMGESVILEPATVVLKAGMKRQVALRAANGETLKILNIGFEEDIVNVTVVQGEQTAAGPAAIEITALAPTKPDRLATIAIVETDAPGGSRVYVPVSIAAE
jgi:hypothetical protein